MQISDHTQQIKTLLSTTHIAAVHRLSYSRIPDAWRRSLQHPCGLFKRCPAFVRVLAIVLRHSVLLGKSLNGAQIDFAFLNGIIANKAAVFSAFA